MLHLGEETKDADITVPRSKVISLIINFFLAFIFLLGLLFGVQDIESILDSPTPTPIVEIMYKNLQSKKATTGVIGLFIVVCLCEEMGTLASLSRLTWAFARDNGLPFSKFFAHVRPNSQSGKPFGES